MTPSFLDNMEVVYNTPHSFFPSPHFQIFFSLPLLFSVFVFRPYYYKQNHINISIISSLSFFSTITLTYRVTNKFQYFS